MSSYQFWPAPAKLNLFLQITGQRDDGYHNLQTVFQFLDVADRLRLVVRDDGKIMRKTDNEGIKAEDDLVVKAAKALQIATGTDKGADIYLQKILPMGGGVGGGSSDAATTLMVLNHMWGTELNLEALAEIGLSLGADVPVFIHGHAAFAQGVGEKVEEISPEEAWYLVVHPEVHVSTSELFNNSQLTRDCPAIRICDLQIGTANEERVFDELGNVFEPVVAEQYPEIAEVIQFLRKYSNARLTGTGACVFATFGNKEAAQDVLAKLPDYWAAFVAKGLNRSPLQVKLAAVENDQKEN
ncbi:MAG: 4-(cytidine 5'-diphospho)-2-C-methyl-D-erythritol kinase [endosymbiont of Galathealinum brachiosum]|uniref:4-diphosphocytidyl-2-C-methyl-D-erythritol kinase n=1 Tax=endosymbiont of Galathealinum brachiosum TaxID=2200906 RepID=A0A370DAW1_9GAMM|nr:MAG: 4-(cytidine 5'-diphospho)-2-C-methyl-D-erythritol kinase [endosymbiont of Galathealinum brachiosum]